eukprot:jgi/Tetstr1/440844/TSEL_003085.t1
MENALVPRYNSRSHDPRTEAVGSLAQPDDTSRGEINWRILGRDDIGHRAVDFVSAAHKPRSIKAYDASDIKLYFDFCVADGVMPLEADAATIVYDRLRLMGCRSPVMCPAATNSWQLHGIKPGSWTSVTIIAWGVAAYHAVGAAPPPGVFVWTSHSLCSGNACAASAAGVPLPTTRWVGAWAIGSRLVLDYILPGIIDNPGGGRLFFFSRYRPAERPREPDTVTTIAVDVDFVSF